MQHVFASACQQQREKNEWQTYEQVVDGARGHSVTVRRQGWPDAVVWNPWTEKAKATGDFGDEEYQVWGCTDGWTLSHDMVKAPALGPDRSWRHAWLQLHANALRAKRQAQQLHC